MAKPRRHRQGEQMSDIVERLRGLIYQEQWMEEAADEIERLRADLAETRKLNEILRAKLDHLLRGHAPQMPQAIGEPNWGEGVQSSTIAKVDR